MPTAVQRLADELVPDRGPLHDEIAGWLRSSRRFRAFAEAHREKIRKKLRSATDADARLDVRAELRVANLLLADRRIGLGGHGRRIIGTTRRARKASGRAAGPVPPMLE